MNMILVDGIVLGVAASLLTGGSVRHAASARLQGESALILALGAHLAWPRLADWLQLGAFETVIVWVLTSLALFGLALANARRLGMTLASIGVVLNLLVVVANGGMPVSVEAALKSGESEAEVLAAIGESPLHVTLDDDARVWWLADVVYVPGPLWHRGMASVGDLLLSLGAGVVAFQATRASSSRLGP